MSFRYTEAEGMDEERVKRLFEVIIKSINDSGIEGLTHADATGAIACLARMEWLHHDQSAGYVTEFVKIAFGLDRLIVTAGK